MLHTESRMVSGKENTSRRDYQEKQHSVEATATKAPAQGHMTEVKKMLDTFLTEQKKQANIIEANSKELKALSRRKRGRPDTARLRARVNPQRLDFSVPRATRGNPKDLPPPPPCRETDKSPERIVDISDQEEPDPTKRARAKDAEGGRQEPRASDTQSASGSSKTEIMKDTSEYTNYSSKEQNKKERERRAFKRSYVAELAAVKAQMDWVTSDLKRTQSQIHHGTGKAPAIAQHYNIFMERKIYDSELWNNKQGETESLRSFMTRFKNTLSKVEGINNKSALEVFRGALRCPSPFWQEMSLNTPTTIQDALHRAADFARTEEEVQARKGGKTKQASEPAHASNPVYIQYEGGSGGVHNYQVESLGYEGPKEYDEELYCDFHKTNGHSTAKCRELGQQLIAKLTEGTLKGNVSLSDSKPEEKAPANTEQQVDTPRGQRRDYGMENEDQDEVINMIMGGSQYCADNETAIEAYQRRADVCANILAPAKPRLSSDPITFDEQDTEGLDQPHNDPLVINLTIYDFNVARALIDTGSSVDVIFKKTLERMKIDLSTIKGQPKLITGFSGEITMTMGTVRLPVQVGNVKNMVDFTVSDHPTIYNMIIGTPWLNQMRAVPSTYHLCLKFPTPIGVKTIWGNQKESRMCFMAEHKLRNTEKKKEESSPQESRKRRRTSSEHVNDLTDLL
ncbi:hypothetical protein AALP_AA7G204900 [Arabis alpina]|uniref:Retrotransposon gag domain-containing protein n=1 Tax=Arabis alpina TaxID=50452 RepID=A0A087GJE9_ARAAL|nr:hypothetical protein AALP_AA7G204900 [Arabis alpina]